ncbi:PLP-dependent transferase [Candidatus Gottesmanbacteria bacterium]|nr:PLP-dependent transferase [Candidatus Gottesmanbacteria bacterium]
MIIDNQLLNESFEDLREDFEELEYLINSDLSHLQKFLTLVNRFKNQFREQTYQLVLKDTLNLKNRFEKYFAEIKNIAQKAKKAPASASLIQKLIIVKDSYFDLIRSQYSLVGFFVTSFDWQSPSFAASLYSAAGKQTGQILGTLNDYKRDAHLDEKDFERKYLSEYIDAPLKFGIHVYMTGSGQAAFTTIFNFLLMEEKMKGKILLGKSSYFQYKQLLIGALRDKIIEVDERETDNLLEIIKKEKPSAIFLDSLCNAKDIPVPDLINLIKFLVNDYREEIYLVIDNTCLTIAFQPFKMLIGKTRKVHLIMFESLMKYHHFGLDRATGGIIVAYGRDTEKLFDYRKHSGTNIADSSVYMFPIPNRKMLEARLKRLWRNAFQVSSFLQNYLEHKPNKQIEKIVYPLCGSFFNIGFKKKNIRKYKQLVNLVIAEAKKKNIQIVGGTSFGLNNTRIYLTSLWTKFGEPFVRVSVGTENRYQIEIIKKVFIYSIGKIERWW